MCVRYSKACGHFFFAVVVVISVDRYRIRERPSSTVHKMWLLEHDKDYVFFLFTLINKVAFAHC